MGCKCSRLSSASAAKHRLRQTYHNTFSGNGKGKALPSMDFSLTRFTDPLLCCVCDVYDGDTIRVWTVLPWQTSKSPPLQFRVRLVGIDAPEMRVKEQKPDAIKARDALAKRIFDKTSKEPKFVWMEFPETEMTDPYGRQLGVIYEDKKDVGHFSRSINHWMVAEKYAVKWNPTQKKGGQPKPF